MAREHVALLAFADIHGDLPELREEIRRLQELFEANQRDGRCTLVFRPNATLKQLYLDLQVYRDRIAIFHYGGHADSGRLFLEEAMGGGLAHAEGLATLLGQQRGLKLVFLNGCSTRPQVRSLLAAGVPAVIATARPIKDDVARKVAVAFYEALTIGGNGLAGGQSIAASFVAAQGFVGLDTGPDTRHMVVSPPAHDDLTDALGRPWDILYRAGAEQVKRWNLFDDDPLFGVPELPDDIGLPADPFRKLEWFGREHARIFFGRGRAIRELYDLVRRPAIPGEVSVLLYYGQTGVGKTSVLQAGLLPRLESQFQVRYLRRKAQLGLLGTLIEELAPSTPDCDLGAAWVAKEEPSPDSPLLVILDQAEEVFTQPLDAPDMTPEAEVRALVEALRAVFQAGVGGRPGGKLILSFRKEWLDEFEKACKAANLAFESVPLGPLDHFGIVEAVRGLAGEPDSKREPSKYQLTITPEEPSLPEFIADDLLDTLADPKNNQVSPIAPTLQLLLTRMWDQARKANREHPTFDRSLYTDLKAKGYLLGEVLDQQFAEIRKTDIDAVDRGLLLDLLEWFTTRLGTAFSHTLGEIQQRYLKQPKQRLERLLRLCQSHYLLAETSFGTGEEATFRLTHDTLAPIIRDRFQSSLALVPRARRAVEKKALELASWEKTQEGNRPFLEPNDLEGVEAAVEYLPSWTTDETALVQQSRQTNAERQAAEVERQRQLRAAETEAREARERRIKDQETANQRLRHRLHALAVLVVATLGFAAYSVVEWREANEQKRLAEEATDKAEKATDAANENLRNERKAKVAAQIAEDFARRNFIQAQMGIVQQAWDQGDVKRVLASLRKQRPRPGETDLRGFEWYYFWRLCHGDLTTTRGYNDGVNWFTYAPGSGLTLWNAATQQTRDIPREAIEASSRRAASPDGKLLATLEDREAVRLWDLVSGKHRVDLQEPLADITSLVFSFDGKTLATAYAKGVKLWDTSTGREKWTPTTFRPEQMAFSPDNKTMVLLDRSTGKRWDLTRESEPVDFVAPLRSTRRGESFAFVTYSPDGKWLALGTSSFGPETVRLFDVSRVSWKEQDPFWWSSVGRSRSVIGMVNSAAFSPDGKWLALGSSVWNLDTRAQSTLRGHTGRINAVAFSDNGTKMVTGGEDTMVKLWELSKDKDAEYWQDLATFKGHLEPINAVAFSHQHGRVVSASKDQKVKTWDAFTDKNGTECKIVATNAKSDFLAFSENGKVLGCYSDVAIELWDVAKGERIGHFLVDYQNFFRGCALFADGKTVCSISEKSVTVWEKGKDKPRWDKPPRQKDARLRSMHFLALSPDGKTLATRVDIREKRENLPVAHEVQLWDVSTGKEGPVLPGFIAQDTPFSPDGQTLVLESRDNGAILWNVVTGQPRTTFPGRRPFAFSPSGDKLVSMSLDKKNLTLWEVATDKEPRMIPLQNSRADSMAFAFSPNGRILATDDFDKGIRRWDVATGTELPAIPQPKSGIRALAFARDEQVVATRSRDNNVSLWDVVTGQERITLHVPLTSKEGTRYDVEALTFSPDRRTLAAVCAGTVLLWQAASEEEIAEKERSNEELENVPRK